MFKRYSLLAAAISCFAMHHQLQASVPASTGWDELKTAINKGDAAAVKAIVPSKIKPYETAGDGRFAFQLATPGTAIAYSLAWQAMHPAIENGKLDIVEALVGGGYIAADARTRGRGQYSLLEMAQYQDKKKSSDASKAIIKYLQGQLAKSGQSMPAKTTTNAGAIKFYDNSKPYYEFSNFYEGKQILLNGKPWRTGEECFQAMKFQGARNSDDLKKNDAKIQKMIQLSGSPEDARRIAKFYSSNMRQDWHRVRDTAMLEVIRAKFSQDEKLKKLLLSTGDQKIILAAPKDDYWGDPSASDKGGAKGKNKLGEILMQVRNELRKESAAPIAVAKTQQKQSAWSTDYQQSAQLFNNVSMNVIDGKIPAAKVALTQAVDLIKKMKNAGENLRATDSNGQTLLQKVQDMLDLIGKTPKELEAGINELFNLLL